jgi:hypothetical protein
VAPTARPRIGLVLGGASFDTELPVHDNFVLGGPTSLPGLSTGQLRGNSYWSGSAAYLHRIGDINPLYGQTLYLGAAFTAADMSDRIDGVRSEPIYSGALILGGRTPLVDSGQPELGRRGMARQGETPERIASGLCSA